MRRVFSAVLEFQCGRFGGMLILPSDMLSIEYGPKNGRVTRQYYISGSTFTCSECIFWGLSPNSTSILPARDVHMQVEVNRNLGTEGVPIPNS